MDTRGFGSVRFKASSEDSSHGGQTTPNDDFWEESVASKSVFMFDDDDDDASWKLDENHFIVSQPPSIGTKNSTNTSTTSSFESLQRFDDQLTIESAKTSSNSSKIQKQQQAQASSLNIHQPPAVSTTISNIVRNGPYILDVYRSKADKIELLNLAIASGDGNAITAAVLHVRKSLKVSLFNTEMRTRPVAVNHYINFLRDHYDFNELYDLLIMLGRTEEAAMLKLKLAFGQKNVEHKIAQLEQCLKFHFKSDPSLAFYADMIENQISLLQKQLAIAKHDEQVQRQQQAANQNKSQIPRSPSPPPSPLTLIGMPVITCVYYCTLHHYNEPENSFSSPISLKKSYQLTDKQFTWTVVNALAKKKDWKSIEAFLTTKGIFGGSKLRSCIGFEKVARILNTANAPQEETSKYLKQIDSIDERLNFAKQFQCHNLIIDTYVQMKDAQSLTQYKRQLKPGTPEYSYIENALRASTVKWRN